MASAYINLPKKLMDKIQNLQVSAPNIASRVLGVGVGAAEERMKQEFAKAANKGYGTGYTLSKIVIMKTDRSTPDHPSIFIGAVDKTAASRMKYIEGGRVRHKLKSPEYQWLKGRIKFREGFKNGHLNPGDRLQKARPYMGKVRKFIRSRECKKLMEDRFKKIIDSL
ncbi:MAG: hypothetical protein ACYCWE_20925 [Eubacteriales bacterium]